MPLSEGKSQATEDTDWIDEEIEENAGDAYAQYGIRRLTVEDLDIEADDDKPPRIFARGIYHAFKPYERFMHTLCRYPCESQENDGIFQFSFKKSKPYAIGFCVLSVILGILTLLVVVNTVGILLDSPKCCKGFKGKDGDTLRAEEWYLFRRNVVPVIILVTCLIHTTIGNINFFIKRHFACTYLSFWMEAAEIMRIDVSSGLYTFMWWTLFAYGTFIILLLTLCAIQFAPVSTGAPALFTMLTFRFFVPQIHAMDYFYILRGIAAFVFLYVLICSKSYVFLFLYYTKLLKNAFVTWNHRLDRVLHRGEGSLTRAEKIANRTGYDHLFKDHVCLLDLLTGIDTLFSNIIESYYATQVFSICFEVYYFYRSQAATEEFTSVRRLDGIIVTLYLINTFVVLFMVSSAAADVGEEAMDGLEIIRRKGMLGRKTDEELYFMLSMYISYTGHFETAIMGGKYFTLDKGFMVGITGTIFSYFIILMQFTPPLTITSARGVAKIMNSTALLSTAEGTRLFGGVPENISKAIYLSG